VGVAHEEVQYFASTLSIQLMYFTCDPIRPQMT